jgi:hypothetical protein
MFFLAGNTPPVRSALGMIDLRENSEKMVGAVRFELASHFIGFPSKTSYSQ